MACPRPGMGQDVAAIAYTSHSPTESLMVARGVERGNRSDYEMVDSYTSGALQLVKSIVTIVAFVALVSLVSLVYAHNQFYFVILSALSLSS